MTTSILLHFLFLRILCPPGCLRLTVWICSFSINQHASICAGFGAPPEDPEAFAKFEAWTHWDPLDMASHSNVLHLVFLWRYWRWVSAGVWTGNVQESNWCERRCVPKKVFHTIPHHILLEKRTRSAATLSPRRSTAHALAHFGDGMLVAASAASPMLHIFCYRYLPTPHCRSVFT